MKKKNTLSENYLDKIPVRSPHLKWTSDESGKVTLEIKNTGFFNRIAQKLFKKPEISYVHLDKTGSFIWPLIDGKTDILSLGEALRKEFGDEAEPLYERLSEFFRILASYNFITFTGN